MRLVAQDIQMRESKYINLLFFFTLIIVFLLGGCSFNERFKAKPIYQEANAFFRDGDYQASLEKYEEIAEKFPSAADDALFQMGIIYAHPKNQQKDYDKSLECFYKLINDYQTSEHRHDVNMLVFYIENAIIKDRTITTQQMKIDALQQEVTTKQVEITTFRQQIEALEQNIFTLKTASLDKIIVEKKKRLFPFKLKEPHGRQIDDNPFSGSVRQDKIQRQHDPLSGLRHPYIHPRIGGAKGIDPQAEVPCYVR